MKTIYNTYVTMESQEQCDRMKQLCIDNRLPISGKPIGFEYNPMWGYAFKSTKCGEFGVYEIYEIFSKVTEKEFIKLLKNTKL